MKNGIPRIGHHIHTVCNVGTHLQEPAVLNLDDLAHVLLGREDELVVHDPAGILLEQCARRVDLHALVVLHRLVRSTLGEPEVSSVSDD